VKRIREVLALGGDDALIPVSTLKKTGVGELMAQIGKIIGE
jgi:hypothetical protein